MYSYGSRSLDHQLKFPTKGFYDRMHDNSGKYKDIIVYRRKLSDEECLQYQLEYIEK